MNFKTIIFSLTFVAITSLQCFSQQQEWTLQQCIDHALSQNLSVQQSQLKQRSSELQYKQAKFERLPSLSASASQSLLDPQSTSLGVSANVNLFKGFHTEKNIQKSKLELQKQATQTELTKFDITTAVIESFLQVLYSKESVESSRLNVESSQAQLTLAQAKFKVGSIAIKDLSDIEAQHANNEFSFIRAENQYAQQRLNLLQLLEIPVSDSIEIATPEINSANYQIPNAMDVYRVACGVVPQIKSAEQQSTIDSLSIKLARSGYYPSLSLSAGLGASADFFDSESELRGNNSLRLSLSVPIFDKLQTKTNVENAKINAEYNILAMESTKKNLYKEIESVCQSAVAYQKELEVLEKSEISAMQSYELAQKQFQVGATDATTLLLAQSKFIEANLSKIQAKYMAILYYLMLQQYQGNSISL